MIPFPFFSTSHSRKLFFYCLKERRVPMIFSMKEVEQLRKAKSFCMTRKIYILLKIFIETCDVLLNPLLKSLPLSKKEDWQLAVHLNSLLNHSSFLPFFFVFSRMYFQNGERLKVVMISLIIFLASLSCPSMNECDRQRTWRKEKNQWMVSLLPFSTQNDHFNDCHYALFLRLKSFWSFAINALRHSLTLFSPIFLIQNFWAPTTPARNSQIRTGNRPAMGMRRGREKKHLMNKPFCTFSTLSQLCFRSRWMRRTISESKFRCYVEDIYVGLPYHFYTCTTSHAIQNSTIRTSVARRNKTKAPFRCLQFAHAEQWHLIKLLTRNRYRFTTL